MQDALNEAVRDLAHVAFAQIQAKVQSTLSSTRLDYLKALKFSELGDNTYLIALESDWANALEDGFGSYNLTDRLLASTKTVEVGSRAGQPWVQHTKPTEKKASHKFGYVPFERKSHTKEGKYAGMAKEIQGMKALNKFTHNFQNITDVFRDASGAAVAGKVATGKSDNPFLDQLVKYQHVDPKTQRVSSIYINYRCVSEMGKPWIHPGYSGLGAFKDAESFIESQMSNIVRIIAKGE
jgi:hypothetical protein